MPPVSEIGRAQASDAHLKALAIRERLAQAEPESHCLGAVCRDTASSGRHPLARVCLTKSRVS